MILGTISAIDSDNGLQLIIDGEDEPTTKKYTYMASYVPTVNDRVLIEEISGSYVIMGKVISDVASSGMARVADTAVNATTADTALSANSADALSGASQLSGKLVTNVYRSWNSTVGDYIVTDVSTTAIQNFICK